MRNVDEEKICRVIDANLNRLREGLRVCEDVCRFMLNDPGATRRYKKLRHDVTEVIFGIKWKTLVLSRDIDKDVGKSSTATELQRAKVSDIFLANSQRVKESLRVLEEFLKLLNRRRAQQLKDIRYKVYALEKKIVEKI